MGAKKKAKKEKKKAKKAKKEAKKAKKKLKKLKRKLEKANEKSAEALNPHDTADLTADLLHKDLTLIPRKKLLKMAKVCKTRKAHYQYELAQCVQKKSDDRRQCMDIFNEVKGKIEKRCSRLKELFSRIFTFINDLRKWSSQGGPYKKSSGGTENMKAFKKLLDKKGSTKKIEKKVKKLIKKEAKKAKKSGKKTKKAVSKLKKTLKKGLKEQGGTKRKKKYLKKVKKKLEKQIKKDKKQAKKKGKGVKGLKKMIKKIQKSGKKKKKREKRFKKVLKKLAKAAGDSDSKKSNRRIKAIKAIIGKEAGEGGKKSSSKKKEKKKIKKLLKKLDKKQKKSKKKQGKFLKKLIKREAKKEVRKTRSRSGSKADMHREAGETFLDWLRMKKGSNSKMREWVKAKLDAQEAAYKPRTKVSKKAMKKCMYRKDYRYGGEKMGTSKQEKVEGCCNKCDSTSGCRAWSWDRKSKVCTLISKVDKTGESSTCCIAGRRKKKLVKTKKKTAKKLKKKLDKRIDKMEMKTKLTGAQKEKIEKVQEMHEGLCQAEEEMRKEQKRQQGNKGVLPKAEEGGKEGEEMQRA